MVGFIGREKELSVLERSYGEPSAFLIYGRRRVGKTFLLEHFCEGKRNLFLRAVRGSERDNLDYFADAVSELEGEPAGPYAGYPDFFRDLRKVCSERTVVVIDEYQYLADVNPAVSSYLQHFIDADLGKTESMVVICGSSVSSVRSEGTDRSKPLYGRFRRIIELKPMTFAECRRFHPGMSDIDSLKLYLTFGGIPRYHAEMDGNSYEECIEENCLGDGWLVDEAMFLLGSEFADAERYSAILSAISGGRTSLKEIAEKVGIDKTICSKCLGRLVDMGFVGIVNPMYGAGKRKSYYVRDALFDFNYSVLTRRRALISSREPKRSYKALAHYLDVFLGKRFELFCADLLVSEYNVLEVGKWWRDTKDYHGEVDVTARISCGGNIVDLFCECKFTKEPVGMGTYEVLERRAEDAAPKANRRLMLFSVSGFESELKELADGRLLYLIGPEEIFSGRTPEIS